ncbi:MAG: hypothetical protein KKA42_10750 [candidate division Zixibacteria bacterium]|nr:hypothetical protein [candidate division Zixibacteria bacterium]
MLNQVKNLADEASIRAEEYSGAVGAAKGYIIEHFGQNGLIAAYIALAAIALFVLSRLAKLTLSTVKYLVIPAIALAFLASVILPYSLAVTLPVSVTLCSLVLLFKG